MHKPLQPAACINQANIIPFMQKVQASLLYSASKTLQLYPSNEAEADFKQKINLTL